MPRSSLFRGRLARATPSPPAADAFGQALVARWRRGEDAAFAELFRAYRPLVYGVLYNLLPGDPEIEDVVQAAFVEVFRSLDRFEGRSRLSSWIARVALHVGYHHLRHKRSRPASYRTDALVEEPPAPRGVGDPHEAVERAEVLARTRAVLAGLAPKKRAVFILSELQGLEHAEIAEIVGAGVATVRTRLFYARREFWKKAMEDPVLSAFGAGGAEKGED